MSPAMLEVSAANLAKASLQVALRYQESLLASVRRLAVSSVTVFAFLSLVPILVEAAGPQLGKYLDYVDKRLRAPLNPDLAMGHWRALAAAAGDGRGVWIVTLVAAVISAVVAGMFYETLRLQRRERELVEVLEARQDAITREALALLDRPPRKAEAPSAEGRDELLKAIHDLLDAMPERVRREVGADAAREVSATPVSPSSSAS